MKEDETDRLPSKQAAQARADRITAFRLELAELEREGVLALPAEERSRIGSHHETLLRALAARFDVDVGERERQLSWGMRILSLLGAVALASSAYFFLYQVWGLLATPFQVAILAGGPALLLAATDFAARRERSGYFASLIGLVALTAFILNVVILGRIFNLTPTPHAFLAYGLFGALLATVYGGRLILVASLGSLAFWLAAVLVSWNGAVWTECWKRPETFFPAGLLLLAGSAVRPIRATRAIRSGILQSEMVPVLRTAGLAVFLGAVVFLTYFGEHSFLAPRFDDDAIETSYQVFGFAVCAAAIWLGIRHGWPDVVNTGALFFLLLLLLRLVDWWWDWMPRSYFFLIIGSIVVLALWGLSKLRSGLAARPVLRSDQMTEEGA